jgi:hypothetical protein
MKKLNVFEWHRRFKVGEKLMIQVVSNQKHEGQMEMLTENKPWCVQIID